MRGGTAPCSPSGETRSQSAFRRRIMTGFWLFMVMAAGPATDAKPPAQAARGQAFFFDETAARHCGSCHALAHKGTAVGPDLSRLAHLNARAIVSAIRATRTQYVQNVKTEEWHRVSWYAGAAGSERRCRRAVLRFERHSAGAADSSVEGSCRCGGQLPRGSIRLNPPVTQSHNSPTSSLI